MPVRLPPRRAALFDLDGTLVDTEPIHHESTNRVLAAFGQRLSYEDTHKYIGWAETPFWEDLIRCLSMEATPSELKTARTKAYLEMIGGELEPMPGAVELLSAFQKADIPCAIASSSPREQIEANLRASGLGSFFKAVVSGHDDVKRGKPYPDIYLKAAKLAGAPAAESVAFEDTAVGVRAAQAAGCFTVLIPQPYTGELGDVRPDIQAASLAEIEYN